MFIDDSLAILRYKFRNYSCIPRVTNQESAFGAIRCSEGLANTNHQVPHAIGRIGRTQIREIRSKAHVEVNDFDTCFTRCPQHSSRRDNGSLNHGNVQTRVIEQTALGAKVILHVNDNYGSSSSINRDGFRAGIECDVMVRIRCSRRHWMFSLSAGSRVLRFYHNPALWRTTSGPSEKRVLGEWDFRRKGLGFFLYLTDKMSN